MNKFLSLAVVGTLLGFGGCASTHSQTDLQAEILQLDAEWLKAAQSRDVDRVVSYWAQDAIVFPPGRPAVVGRAAIREFVVKSFEMPGFSISWKTATVTVSSSGDIAYATGSNRVTFNTPDGKSATVDGQSVVVWRRQTDGSWKCVIDIWNDMASSQ